MSTVVSDDAVKAPGGLFQRAIGALDRAESEEIPEEREFWLRVSAQWSLLAERAMQAVEFERRLFPEVTVELVGG